MSGFFTGLSTELSVAALAGYILLKTFKNRNECANHHAYFCYVVLFFLFSISNLCSAASVARVAFTGKGICFFINLVNMTLLCAASMRWFLYQESVTGAEWSNTRLKRGLLLIPLVLFFALCVASYRTHWIFYVDESGYYIRGEYYLLQYAVGYLYMVLSGIRIFSKVLSPNAEGSKANNALVGNTFLILIGCILQILFNHSYIAIAAVIGLVFTYIELYSIEDRDIEKQKEMQLLLKQTQEQKEQLQIALDNFKQADYDRRTDFLTGLHNRQDMFEMLSDTLSGKRDAIQAMFMLDIDNFKKLNDHYGHSYGDECLKQIGKALIEYGENNKVLFYRYGGEEVLGVSFGTLKSAETIAGEIVQLVRDQRIERDDTPQGIVTISLGYTTDNSRYEKMIDRADCAMYCAKDYGKNQYVCFEKLETNGLFWIRPQTIRKPDEPEEEKDV